MSGVLLHVFLHGGVDAPALADGRLGVALQGPALGTPRRGGGEVPRERRADRQLGIEDVREGDGEAEGEACRVKGQD